MLWPDVVRPVGEHMLYNMARYTKGWQQKLEKKGSKECGTWKNSFLQWKWRLFCVGLIAIYGVFPFCLWCWKVLPNVEGQDSKHERIVLLASIGLTAYGLGLVWYWTELQRQGMRQPFCLLGSKPLATSRLMSVCACYTCRARVRVPAGQNEGRMGVVADGNPVSQGACNVLCHDV